MKQPQTPTQHDGDPAGGHEEVPERNVAFVVAVADHHQPLQAARHLVSQLPQSISQLPVIAGQGHRLLVLLPIIHVLWRVREGGVGGGGLRRKS